jgi:hypothetical protein
VTEISVDQTFIELGQHEAAACDPTQEIADQVDAPPSAAASEADFNETRRVALYELSVRPIPQTPVNPAPAQILFCNHHLSSTVESGGT